MHIELIDLLRCPRDHDETWLVAAFTEIRDRVVYEGRLGCPICNAEYPIRFGIADFAAEPGGVRLSSGEVQPDPETAVRLAAFLNLTKPGSIAVLHEQHGALATLISELTQCRILALDPAGNVTDTDLTATAHSDSRIPLGSSSVEAVALTNSRYLEDSTRVLKQGGRLLAPSQLALPPGLTELARDDEYVVAEAHGPVISLRRS